MSAATRELAYSVTKSSQQGEKDNTCVFISEIYVLHMIFTNYDYKVIATILQLGRTTVQ